jgi:ribosomal protein L37AE/L43A
MWVETPRERIERIRDAGPFSHVCPLCKYDMSGLKNLTCPECGVEFTVASWTREQHDRRMAPDTDA